MSNWLDRVLAGAGIDTRPVMEVATANVAEIVRQAAEQAQRATEEAAARKVALAVEEARVQAEQTQCVQDTFDTTQPQKTGLVMFGETKSSIVEKRAVMVASGGHVTFARPSEDFAKRACLRPEQASDLLTATSSWNKEGLEALAPLFAQAEHGTRKLDRLLVSGHGGATGPFEFSLSAASKLVELYPNAAKQVEHLMLAACHSNHPGSFERWKAIFPNLKTLSGYDRSAPSGGRAATQIAQWTQATKSGGSALAGLDREVATWTATRGYRGTLPAESMENLRAAVNMDRHVYERYERHSRPLSDAPNDQELTAFYALLQRLAQHKDATKSDQKYYTDWANKILGWRHPELVAPAQ